MRMREAGRIGLLTQKGFTASVLRDSLDAVIPYIPMTQTYTRACLISRTNHRIAKEVIAQFIRIRLK